MVIPMVVSKNHLKQRQGLVGISWVGPLFPVLQSWLTVFWLAIPETKHARILVVATGKGEEPKVYPIVYGLRKHVSVAGFLSIGSRINILFQS